MLWADDSSRFGNNVDIRAVYLSGSIKLTARYVMTTSSYKIQILKSPYISSIEQHDVDKEKEARKWMRSNSNWYYVSNEHLNKYIIITDKIKIIIEQKNK